MKKNAVAVTAYWLSTCALCSAAALVTSTPASALSIGNPQASSRLTQSLRLRVPVTDADTHIAASAYQVRLLPAESYSAYALDRPTHPLDDLSVALEPSGSGTFWLNIASDRPIREPILILLVEMRLGSEKWIRQLDLLLDPPQAGAATNSPLPVEVQDLGAASPQFRTDYSGAELYGPVRDGESLSRIAQRARPEKSIPIADMAAAIRRMNPDAFFGDMHELKRGIMLRIPSRDELARSNASLRWYAQPAVAASTKPQAKARPSSTVVPRLIKRLQGHFLGLDMQFYSYIEARRAKAEFLSSLQAREPMRFQADWTLAASPVKPEAPVAPVKASRPEPIVSRPTAMPSADVSVVQPVMDTPSVVVASVVAPAPTFRAVAPQEPDEEQWETTADTPTDEAASVTVASEDSDSGNWPWWLLFFAALGGAYWWRARSTATHEQNATDQTAEDYAPRARVISTAVHTAQTVQTHTTLRKRIHALETDADAAAQRELQVALALLDRDQPERAEHIILELENPPRAQATAEPYAAPLVLTPAAHDSTEFETPSPHTINLEASPDAAEIEAAYKATAARTPEPKLDDESLFAVDPELVAALDAHDTGVPVPEIEIDLSLLDDDHSIAFTPEPAADIDLSDFDPEAITTDDTEAAEEVSEASNVLREQLQRLTRVTLPHEAIRQLKVAHALIERGHLNSAKRLLDELEARAQADPE